MHDIGRTTLESEYGHEAEFFEFGNEGEYHEGGRHVRAL